jgi:tetratricopeptide (TPR) repeat protein
VELELENAEELQQLVQLGRKIKSFSQLSEFDQSSTVQILFDFECFAQAISLLKFRIDSQLKAETPDQNILLSCFQNLAYAKLLGLEDEDGFISVLIHAAKSIPLSFDTFRFHLVEYICGSENYSLQMRAYKEVSQYLSPLEVRVQSLERLALVLEKKLFLEKEVEPVYSQILALDPNNIKACRFYRVYHSHLLNWSEAAEMLERLLNAFPFQHEKQRTAHELAQVYLYQLSDADKAEKILKQYCEHSFLDARQTWLDCLEKQNRFQELSEFLEQCSQQEQNKSLASQLLHRKAVAQMRLDSDDAVSQTLLRAIELDAKNYVAFETLAVFFAERKKLSDLSHTLVHFQKELSSETGKSTISAILERLEKLA